MAGRLLVAAPRLLDPHFARTVVLMLEHSPEGAFGLVLTRPAGTDLEELLPGWEDLADWPAEVFVGGPVAPDTAIGLVALHPGVLPAGVAALDCGLATVDLDADPALMATSLRHLRVFVGYAGWSEGQLDDELAADGWVVVDALPDDAFDADPGSLWQRVLRRQTGRLRMLANCPLDPSLN